MLDEPTSGLDPLVQDVLADCLREMAGEGSTVFFSSHTLGEVERLCDRVGIVRDGRLVADEDVVGLRRRARREVTLVYRSAEAAAGAAMPRELAEARRDGASWHGVLDGGPVDFLRWASSQPLQDVTIRPPALERVFRRFYDGEGGGPS